MNKLRDDSALRSAFSSLQPNALLLIEDVDVAFQTSRDMNAKNKPMVTFACLLNCLDGVYYKEGLLTVMTTNFVEKLDPALIRPGRMDLKVHIPNPGKKEVEEYMSRFYSTDVVLDEYTKSIPMAAVQGICITHKHDYLAAIDELALFDDTTIIANYVITPTNTTVETDLDLDEAREDLLEEMGKGSGEQDQEPLTGEEAVALLETLQQAIRNGANPVELGIAGSAENEKSLVEIVDKAMEYKSNKPTVS